MPSLEQPTRMLSRYLMRPLPQEVVRPWPFFITLTAVVLVSLLVMMLGILPVMLPVKHHTQRMVVKLLEPARVTKGRTRAKRNKLLQSQIMKRNRTQTLQGRRCSLIN